MVGAGNVDVHGDRPSGAEVVDEGGCRVFGAVDAVGVAQDERRVPDRRGGQLAVLVAAVAVGPPALVEDVGGDVLDAAAGDDRVVVPVDGQRVHGGSHVTAPPAGGVAGVGGPSIRRASRRVRAGLRSARG